MASASVSARTASRLKAGARATVLCIEVRNRNSTLEGGASPAAGHGIGLSNTALRLRELYGDDADVRLDMLWPEGVACRLRLPFHALDQPVESAEATFQ